MAIQGKPSPRIGSTITMNPKTPPQPHLFNFNLPKISVTSPKNKISDEAVFTSATLHDLKGKLEALTSLANMAENTPDFPSAVLLLERFNKDLSVVNIPTDRLPSCVRNHHDFIVAQRAAKFARTRSETCAGKVKGVHHSVSIDTVAEVMSTAASMLMYLITATETLFLAATDNPQPPASSESDGSDTSSIKSRASGMTDTSSIKSRASGVKAWAESTFPRGSTISTASSAGSIRDRGIGRPMTLQPRARRNSKSSTLSSVSTASTQSKSSFRRRLFASSLQSRASRLTLDNGSATPESDYLQAPVLRDLRTPSQIVDDESDSRNASLSVRLRTSAVFVLGDAELFEKDKCPLTVTLNQDEQLKTASLPALIRMLTSEESLNNVAFVNTFFFSFRYFVSPSAFVELLRERYYLKPSMDLSAASQTEWKKAQFFLRVRVVRVILAWLQMFWKPSEDAIAVPALEELIFQDFIYLQNPRTQQQPGVVVLVVMALATATTAGLDMRKVFVASQVNAIASSEYRAILPPTHFRLPSNGVFTLENFWDRKDAAEELARQLTVKVCALVGEIDAEGLVRMYLLQQEDSPAQQAHQRMAHFGQSLHLFVISSILQTSPQGKDRTNMSERIKMLELWVRVAARCHLHKNFSCANFIFCALTASPIIRLKGSIMGVSDVCRTNYKRIQDLFNLSDNYRDYFRKVKGSRVKGEGFIPWLPPTLRNLESSSILRSERPADNLDPASAGDDCEGDSKVVNMAKFRIVYEAITDMEAAHFLFDFSSECTDTLQKWINEMTAKFDPGREHQLMNTFYEISVRLEARGSYPEVVNPWVPKKSSDEHTFPVVNLLPSFS